MRNLTIKAPRLALVLACLVSASACGLAPDRQSEPANATVRKGSPQPVSPGINQLTWRDEESMARADPQCGQALGDFEQALRSAVDRFNTIVKNELPADARNLTVTLAGESMAGISDANSTGQLVVTLVCSSRRLAAYSYSSTVVLSEGLLRAIKEGAQAQAVYSEYPVRLDDALNRIISNARDGEAGAPIDAGGLARLEENDSLRRDFQLTFFSAVAFVLYHELGHVVMEHVFKDQNGYISFMEPFDSMKEFQADSFAAVSMAPAGYSMRGADLVFSILAKLNPEGTSGHPSTWDRAIMARRAAQTGEPGWAAVYITGD